MEVLLPSRLGGWLSRLGPKIWAMASASRSPSDPRSPDDIVIVDAVRTPVGRRNGGYAGIHPADLLTHTLAALVDRTQVDPTEIGQVVGGCVSQVGEQSFNITRTAALAAGLPISVAATTVDTQCGSSQQATNLAISMLAAGVVDVAVACGTE